VIKRLLETALIEELSERPDPPHDDERRRYYRLTPLGRRVAQSEADPAHAAPPASVVSDVALVR
jgi:DNA-binding MarR family transcriptional regulator